MLIKQAGSGREVEVERMVNSIWVENGHRNSKRSGVIFGRKAMHIRQYEEADELAVIALGIRSYTALAALAEAITDKELIHD
jgi:hypothetical protein